MNNFLTSSKKIDKASFVWNMIASTCNSFQSMLILLVITRKGEVEDAAIFSITFVTATLLMYIGKYAVRNYQVSDAKGEYTYGEYVQARKITVCIMVAVTAGYMFFLMFVKEYSLYKAICLLLFIAFRMLEVIEDVFHGDLQQKDRLDIASKIWAIRTISYIIVVIICYALSSNLVFSALMGFLINVILFFFLNKKVYALFTKDITYKSEKVKKLLKDCFPLALNSILLMYIGNCPKYAVDGVVSASEQTCFNVIIMPVFVISLLGNYIYNPMINRLTILWSQREIKHFKMLITKVISFVMLFTITVILVGEFIGIDLLGIIYKVDLGGYQIHFLYLMMAGGMLALYNFLIIVATIIRKQKFLQYISLFIAGILFSTCGIMAKNVGMLGLCQLYAFVTLIMVLFTAVYIFIMIVRESKEHCYG